MEPNKEIYFKIIVGNAKLVHVCGYFFKESLKYAEFFLDLNVNITNVTAAAAASASAGAAVSVPYYPSNNRTQLIRKTNRQYLGDECTSLFNLPLGTHVLAVRSGATATGAHHTNGITHLVVYP